MSKNKKKMGDGKNEANLSLSSSVKKANNRMRNAHKQGAELVDSGDEKKQTQQIRRKSGGNVSRAEKLRKYRQIARQISASELKKICKACVRHNRPWGPTFLVELSKIAVASERRAIYTTATKNHWSLGELKRNIALLTRRSAGAGKTGEGDAKTGSKIERKRVGRKRKLDWHDESQVLFEVHQLCLKWDSFAEDLNLEIEKERERLIETKGSTSKADAALVETSVFKKFNRLTRKVARFQVEVITRLEDLQAQDRSTPTVG